MKGIWVGVGVGVLGLGAVIAGCSDSSRRGASTAAAATTSSSIGTAHSSSPAPTGSATAPTTTATVAGGTSGTFSVLTYNVAGLPQGLSQSDPATNSPLISPKLNAYDLVLVQEDFTYHPQIASSALHPHQSVAQTGVSRLMNDGLNRFSQFPFGNLTRVMWSACNGVINGSNDCLATKGFSFARHTIAPGVEVDVYNLHADAGGGQDDQNARTQQFAQLATYIQAFSAGRAVIVAGDTNLKGTRRPQDETTLTDFMGIVGLTDTARYLGAPEDIDRILWRDGPQLRLVPRRWREADEFKDAAGNDLSDHEAVHVDFDWTK